MKIIKTLSITAVATLAFAQATVADATGFQNGTGTSSDPYIIATISDLNTLASDVNDGENYQGKFFKLDADLDYSSVGLFDSDDDGVADSNFTPIGIVEYRDDGMPMYDNGFAGVFDGAGHSIKGVTVNQSGTEGVGLFGNVKYPGVVKNLKVADSSFTGNLGVGAIAGEYNNIGNDYDTFGIFDCEVAASVTVKAVTSGEGEEELPGWYAGGIVGTANLTTVSGCVSAAEVYADEYAGGITGQIFRENSYSGKLVECYYNGTSVKGGQDAVYVGEIVGLNGTENDDYTAIVAGSEITPVITLLDDDSSETVKNATRISNYDGMKVSITLAGRTLYKDDTWNTLCLPFAVSLNGTPLEGATVKTLTSATFSSGTLTLNFSDQTDIQAGKPYIVKWESGADTTAPVFEGVTIKKSTTDVVTDVVTFKGIFSPYKITSEDKSMLYLGSGNTLYYPNAAMTIYSCRAYFQLADGLVCGDPEGNAVKSFILNLDDTSTNIEEIQNPNSQLSTLNSKLSEWYTLDGRRLNTQPTQRGVYINNGKKYVIQ